MKGIRTRFYGPTDHKGARLVASDSDGNRATISYPHELNTEDAHRSAAQALQAKMGWSGDLIPAWFGSDCYWAMVRP